MFGAILKATNSSFQKGMTFSRSIYVKKVMKLLAFIFEQPSYKKTHHMTLTWGVGVKATQNVAHYSLHHVTYAPAKFGVAAPTV